MPCLGLGCQLEVSHPRCPGLIPSQSMRDLRAKGGTRTGIFPSISNNTPSLYLS